MSNLLEIQSLITAARDADKFPHRGAIAVAVKRGKFQVQRVIYDARGVSIIVECGEFVPFELLSANINAEANFGALS